MSRTDKEGINLRTSVIAEGNVFQTNIQTLGAAVTLGPNAPPVQILDANGAARNVILPSNSIKGQFFYITNTAAGAFSLTVKDATNATLVVTVAQGKTALVVSKGDASVTAWTALLGS